MFTLQVKRDVSKIEYFKRIDNTAEFFFLDFIAVKIISDRM